MPVVHGRKKNLFIGLLNPHIVSNGQCYTEILLFIYALKIKFVDSSETEKAINKLSSQLPCKETYTQHGYPLLSWHVNVTRHCMKHKFSHVSIGCMTESPNHVRRENSLSVKAGLCAQCKYNQIGNLHL